jgi:hypothetical protein
MKQYQKNGKMTMRLRHRGARPDNTAAPGIDGGMEAAVRHSRQPGDRHRMARQASIYDGG